VDRSRRGNWLEFYTVASWVNSGSWHGACANIGGSLLSCRTARIAVPPGTVSGSKEQVAATRLAPEFHRRCGVLI
jgi:hypothetical protein